MRNLGKIAKLIPGEKFATGPSAKYIFNKLIQSLFDTALSIGKICEKIWTSPIREIRKIFRNGPSTKLNPRESVKISRMEWSARFIPLNVTNKNVYMIGMAVKSILSHGLNPFKQNKKMTFQMNKKGNNKKKTTKGEGRMERVWYIYVPVLQQSSHQAITYPAMFLKR